VFFETKFLYISAIVSAFLNKTYDDTNVVKSSWVDFELKDATLTIAYYNSNFNYNSNILNTYFTIQSSNVINPIMYTYTI